MNEYNIGWLVFINATECAYCTVRIGSLYLYIYIYTSGLFSSLNFVCFVYQCKIKEKSTRVTEN